MRQHDFVRQFARSTLGCECPDAVFEDIQVSPGPGGGYPGKISIGGRLLIYIVDITDEVGLVTVVRQALEQGMAERDRDGFNRFRLVLVTDNPEKLRAEAERAYALSGCRDDRTHLHVLSRDRVAGLCD